MGSSAGGTDIYGASEGTATSQTVSNIPTDGRTIYVRIWSYINGGWQYNDDVYSAANSTGSSVLASCSTAFDGTWNGVAFVGAMQASISYNPATGGYDIGANLQNFPSSMQSYLVSATGSGTVSAVRQGTTNIALVNTTTSTGITVNSFGMIGTIPSATILYGGLASGTQFSLVIQYSVQTSSGHAFVPSCPMILTVP